MAGSFVYYETRWRGSPEMVTFLANGVLVCAFLTVVENIFLVNNKMEILKANIRDYLENLNLPPIRDRVAPEDLKEFANLRGQNVESLASKPEEAAKEIAASASGEKQSTVGTVKGSVSEAEPRERAIDNDKVLDSFLKEFFS